MSESDSRAASGSPAVAAVPLSEIDLENRDFQYRLETRPKDLRASLERDGQREPVDLLGPPPYRIVDGFRRIEALEALGATEVRARVHEQLTEDEAHTIAFVKNVVRRNLSPIEKGQAVLVALRRGKDRQAIARTLGLSERQVARYEALARFPEPIQGLVERGMATPLVASVLATFSPPDPEAWALEATRNRWTAADLRRELRRALASSARGRKRVLVKTEGEKLRVYGFSIRRDAPADERERTIEALERALAFMKRGSEPR